MNTALATPTAARLEYNAKLYKVVCLRETSIPDSLKLCESAGEAAGYWFEAIAKDPRHISTTENFYVLMVNTRRRIIAHALVATWTLDTILVHPREVFRPAIVANAAAIVLMHNHPSGDPSPSEADVKITRDLIRAGTLLKIQVLDHVIVGYPSTAVQRGYVSLKELGYFL